MSRIWVVLIVALLGPMGGAAAAQRPLELAIIVHRSNPTDNLTRVELRQLLLLERQSWSDHKKITIVMRDSGQAERTWLLREVVGMNDGAFNRHVLQSQFRGLIVVPPRTISTASGMKRFVFNVPGALGYVLAGEVDDSVKVLRVDGQLPGDLGYALVVGAASDSRQIRGR